MATLMMGLMHPLPIWSQSLPAVEYKIDSLLNQGNISGCQAALFTSDTTLWMNSFGIRNRDTKAAVKDNDLFRMGSVTKTFVAVAVMQLVEQGKLSLDDKVHDLVPEVTFENPWEQTNPVQVVHLLEHTTGWDDISLKEYASSGEGLTLLEGLEYAPSSRVCRWKPGQYMQYCNSGPAVAAYIVEKLTAMPFEDYLREFVLDPLGMASSSMVLDEQTQKLLVKTYVDDRETDYWHILMRPAGSLNSNAGEMVPFVQMLMNEGLHDSIRILNPSSVRRMEQAWSTYTAKTGNHHGYGLHTYTMNFEGYHFHGHAGGMPGALSVYSYSRELDMGFVTMINSSNNEGLVDIIKVLAAYLIGENARLPNPSGTRLNDEYIGMYRTANSRMQVAYPFEKLMNFFSLTFEDGKYYLKSPLSARQEMIPGGEHILFQRVDSIMYDEYVFTKDENGKNIVCQVNAGWANYIETTPLNAWVQLIWFLACLILVISSIIYGLIWITVHLIRKWKKKPIRNLGLKLPPFLGSLLLILSAAMLMLLPGDKLLPWMGLPTFYSVLQYIFSLLFVLFAFISLYRAMVSFSKNGFRLLKFYTLLVSLALTSLAVYFLYWGVVGLPTWV